MDGYQIVDETVRRAAGAAVKKYGPKVSRKVYDRRKRVKGVKKVKRAKGNKIKQAASKSGHLVDDAARASKKKKNSDDN